MVAAMLSTIAPKQSVIRSKMMPSGLRTANRLCEEASHRINAPNLANSMTNSTSLAGKLVTVFGGAGFVGRHLAQHLLAAGARIRIASRNPEKAFALQPLGGLGQIQLMPTDITKDAHIARALAGADMAVNLVGIFNGNLDSVQGSGLGRLARQAAAQKLEALVHISAIGADAGSDVGYASSKAAGEQAIMAGFPRATILRPSVIFGEDDQFINRFAGLAAMIPLALPVIGGAAQFQPVLVDDVAAAVIAALANPKRHGGKIFELGGPDVITMQMLNQRIMAAQHRTKPLLPIPDFISQAIAVGTGWLPGAPITGDQWKMLQRPNVAAADMPGFTALGIDPKPLDLFLDRWMTRYRKAGRFGARSRPPAAPR